MLPLCHIFERMAGHYVMFSAGVTIGYAESFGSAMDNAGDIQPTIMALVPRGYEQIHGRVEQGIRQASPGKRRLAHWAINVAGKRLDKVLAGKRIDPLLAADASGSSSREVHHSARTLPASSTPWGCQSWKGTV